MRYIHLGLIFAAVYLTHLPDFYWVMPALATINVVIASVFYWLCFGLLTGIKSSSVNLDFVVADTWTNRVIQLSATLVLLMSGDILYMTIAAASLPFNIISIVTDAFATLIKWEYVEITDSIEEDEDEEDMY